MPIARFAAAGVVAALLLLVVDLVWIRLFFPEAIASTNTTLALLAELAPEAAGAGILLALAEAMLAVLLSSTARAVEPRLGRARPSTQWRLAILTSAVSVPVALTGGMLVLSGTRRLTPGVIGLVLLAAMMATLLLIVAMCLGARWIESDTRAHRRGLRRLLFAGGAATMAGMLLVLDHTVLVRLYAPMHLALRLGALLSLQAGLLLVVRRVRSGGLYGPLPSRAASIPAAFPAMGLLLVATAASGQWGSASSISAVLLYGGPSATMADLHGRRRNAGDATAQPLETRALAAGAGLALPVVADVTTLDTDARPPAGAVVLPGANVLLITVDALRADHLGSYGYHRPTSAFLDRLASQSVLFERAYTAAPHTSFSLISLLTGRPAVALAQLGRLEGHLTLADLLHAVGYATAAFIPPAVFFVEPERFRTYQQRQLGFRHMEMDALAEDRSAPLQTDQVIAYLDRYRPGRFAAWVHYFGPHEPYVDHPAVGSLPFGSKAVDRYDGEIRWVDTEIGRLVDAVRTRYPRTIVVVTADHGEEFGEHGGAYHGTTLFDEQVRVPLLISIPGVPPARIAAPASALDVLPTLLGALELKPPPDLMGADLRRWMGGSPQAAGVDDRAVVSENGATMRMTVGAGHKLICSSQWPDCLLFDLANDPGERRDVRAQRPALAAQLGTALGGWLAQVALPARAPLHPAQEQPPSAQQPRPPSLDSEPAPPGPSLSPTELPSPHQSILARARLRDPSALPGLLAVLLSGEGASADERRTAARSIGLMARPRDRTALQKLLRMERDIHVACWLRVGLTRLGDGNAARRLEQVLREQPAAQMDAELLTHAALELARVSAAPPTALLAHVLTLTGDVETRCDIFRALGRSADRAEAGRLLSAHYDTIRTRVCVARGLALLGDPATLTFVTGKLLEEPYASVQLRLVDALEKMGDREAIAVLLSLRESTREPEVRAASERALNRLDSTRPVPTGRRRASAAMADDPDGLEPG